MKKLYKLRILLPALLIVALFAGCAGGGGGNRGDGRPATAEFFDILAGDTYHIKGAADGITMEAYYKNDMLAMIFESDEGNVGRRIGRDGKIYDIHDAERIMSISDDDLSSLILPFADSAYVESGESEFDGKTLPYDEYNTGDGNKIWLFIDGSSPAGLRSFDDGESNDMVILLLDKNIPDSVFDLPEGYEEIRF